jgi:hypothetical protein
MKTAKSNTSKRPAPAVESFASVWDALADTPERPVSLPDIAAAAESATR